MTDSPNAASHLLPTATPAAARRALRREVARSRGLAVSGTIALLAGSIAALLTPPVLGTIVDRALAGGDPSVVTGPVLLLLGVAVLAGLGTGLGQALVARLGERVLAARRERALRRALDLPLARVEAAGSGDLVARISGDVEVVSDAVRTVLPALARSGLTVGLTVVGLFALDWRFALAGLLAAPVQLYTLRWYLGRSAPIYAQERVAEGARSAQLIETVGGAATVRAFRLGPRHLSAVDARSSAAVDTALASVRMATRFYARLNLAELVGLVAVLVVGFRLVGDGAVTIGATTAAALYFHQLFDPINALLGLFDEAQKGMAGVARLVGVADAPGAEGGTAPRPPRDGHVVVRSVSFGYTPGRPVLHDVSCEIAPGERVAVVGASGAGKTTLAKLLAGVHPVASGEITIGGVPVGGGLAGVAPGSVETGSVETGVPRRPLALVTQEVHVFSGTLREDLRLAAPDAADDQLRAALATVGALDWVQALPSGLDEVVGDGGTPLTAAQAQQLALARLVLADPLVAVLDEATADAGSAGARVLDAAADAALSGRSALVVAHRLSQAARADRILVLEAGRVVETGSHDELVAAGGRYAGLWALWSGARAAGTSAPA